MSTINVTNLSGRGGATPNLPDGANITGVATATSFDGSLKTTGTPTLGLGVTINSSGINISGVATAGIGSFTTVYGDGSNLTGVGESIAPWHYNPDAGDSEVTISELTSTGSGIGITFNKKVVAGSGTATLKIVNAGAAGTTIQSWGVSSCTFNTTQFTLGSLVSDLTLRQTYQVDIPAAFIDDSNGNSYVGTAFTFAAQGPVNKLWSWGWNDAGQLGDSSPDARDISSPVQVPGIYSSIAGSGGSNEFSMGAIKEGGTLWTWGENNDGQLGHNNQTEYSSPVQIGSDATWKRATTGYNAFLGTKTDGTLWGWGYNGKGELGQNSTSPGFSSPVQIPGTTWTGTKDAFKSGKNKGAAIKTDGTLWTWGYNIKGVLGHNNEVDYSSPVQVPGTNWSKIDFGNRDAYAIKTDGTLWAWGYGHEGRLGINQPSDVDYSSPVQIPGTNWSQVNSSEDFVRATKTDGTLWAWGNNGPGGLGQNDRTQRSSPVQIPGTNWNNISGGNSYSLASKTDGTLWGWGYNDEGQLGQNNTARYSSPVQIGSSTEWNQDVSAGAYTSYAIQVDETP